MGKVVVSVLLGCLLWLGFVLTADAGRVINNAAVSMPFNHRLWEEVLSQSVDEAGSVDFISLKASPGRLNQYLKQLDAVSPLSCPECFPTSQAALAYWINAHNAIALRLILDAYPVTSVADIPRLDTSQRYKLGGNPTSLADIRQRIISRYPTQPEALFALSDASYATPPLLNQAYQPATLKDQLKQVTRNFLQEPQAVQLTPGVCGGVMLHAVLKRYQPALEQAMRFRKSSSSNLLLAFLMPYLPPEVQGDLSEECARTIQFLPPDFRLRSKS